MAAWIVSPVAGLIEPAVAPEFYIDGIGGIELVNGCVRGWLYAEQMPLHGADGDEPHRIVQCKIIGPMTNIPRLIGQLAQCLWSPTAVPAVRKTGDAPTRPVLVT